MRSRSCPISPACSRMILSFLLNDCKQLVNHIAMFCGDRCRALFTNRFVFVIGEVKGPCRSLPILYLHSQIMNVLELFPKIRLGANRQKCRYFSGFLIRTPDGRSCPRFRSLKTDFFKKNCLGFVFSARKSVSLQCEMRLIRWRRKFNTC